MTIDLVIENGTVVSSLGTLKTDIAIDQGKILALGRKSAFPEAVRVIDAEGKIVIPGGIDTHSHFAVSLGRNKAPETWESASIAAAIGGTTTTMDFAIQEKGKTLLDAVKAQFAEAEALSVIDYTTRPIPTDLTDLDKLLDGIQECIDYGVTGFKGATIYRKLGWYEDDWHLYRIMKKVQEAGGMMGLHTENCLIGEEMASWLISQGKTDPKYHGFAKPNFVENMDIKKACTLAEELGTYTYIAHTTTKEGPDIIQSYRDRGVPVFCETCPHYLWLTEDNFEPKFPRGIMYMCAPPLRKQADIEALWDGIKAGTVQITGSDHCAFTKSQKEGHCDTFLDIQNGAAGCEVRLPIIFQEGVTKRGVSLEKFVDVVSTNAAKISGMYPKKGVIAPDSDADIVVFDPNKKHSLNAVDLHMETDLSVYEGMEVIGWPVMTILRGKVIVEDEKFVGKTGQGQFVKAKLDPAVMASGV